MKNLAFTVLAAICIIATNNASAQTAKNKKPAAKKKASTTVNRAATPAKATTPSSQNSNSENTTTTISITTNNNTKKKSTNSNNDNDPLGLNLGNGSHISKGATMLDLGVGFNSYGIPLHAAAEKIITNDISVGLFGNYMSYNPSGFFASTYSYSLIYAGVKGNYYFNHLLGYGIQKYQLYAGLNIGFAKLITTDNSFTGYQSRPFLGGQVGGRYFFNKRFGIYAEGDYSGASGGTIGLTIKLK
jgi:outer membrane immunogenic protein